MNVSVLHFSCAVWSVFLAAVSGAVVAQEKYPVKPVRVIVPFAPGGGADISARAIAGKLSERFGQQVLVDNRPGAGGNHGTELAWKAVPDGYTILLVSSSYGANPSLYKLAFDPVTGFEPVTLVSQQPFIAVVHPSLPVKRSLEVGEGGKRSQYQARGDALMPDSELRIVWSGEVRKPQTRQTRILAIDGRMPLDAN